MNLGAEINSISKRYYVNYDKITHVMRILDLQNPAVQKIKNWDEDIEDTNPAVTVVPELMLSEIIGESVKLGLIRPFGDVTVEMQDTENTISKLKEENRGLKESNAKLLEEVKGSEQFRIKKQILNILEKGIVTEDILSINK